LPPEEQPHIAGYLWIGALDTEQPKADGSTVSIPETLATTRRTGLFGRRKKKISAT
jgi:hypothetical protein